jgi:hypothetical protein
VSEVVSEAVCGVMPSGFMGAFLWIGMGAIVGGVGREGGCSATVGTEYSA